MNMRQGRAAFEPYKSESDLEEGCRLKARYHGYKLIKITSGIGDPDRLLVGHKIAPACVWLEMKTPKGQLSAMQKQRKKELTDAGYYCATIRDVNQFSELLRELNKYGIKALMQHEG